MKALMKLVDYLTETGMNEEAAHELLSQFLEEEAANYIAFKRSLKKKVTKKKTTPKKKASKKKAAKKVVKKSTKKK